MCFIFLFIPSLNIVPHILCTKCNVDLRSIFNFTVLGFIYLFVFFLFFLFCFVFFCFTYLFFSQILFAGSTKSKIANLTFEYVFYCFSGNRSFTAFLMYMYLLLLKCCIGNVKFICLPVCSHKGVRLSSRDRNWRKWIDQWLSWSLERVDTIRYVQESFALSFH
jgi:hypothetical protein